MLCSFTCFSKSSQMESQSGMGCCWSWVASFESWVQGFEFRVLGPEFCVSGSVNWSCGSKSSGNCFISPERGIIFLISSIKLCLVCWEMQPEIRIISITATANVLAFIKSYSSLSFLFPYLNLYSCFSSIIVSPTFALNLSIKKP